MGRERNKPELATWAKSVRGDFLGATVAGGCLTPPNDKPTGGRRCSYITAGPGGAHPAQLLCDTKHAEMDRNSHIYGDEEQTSLSALICGCKRSDSAAQVLPRAIYIYNVYIAFKHFPYPFLVLNRPYRGFFF